MLADRGIRLDEAATLIQRALTDDPNNAAYQDSLGWAYFKQNKLDEWHRALPAEFEPTKMAEVEQKITALKRRLAQQKTPGDAKP